MNVPIRGVGLQLNPTVVWDVGMDALSNAGVTFDFGEILCDVFAGPRDSGYVFEPANRGLLDELLKVTPLIAHGNYGGEFGFEPLEETLSVQRHLAIADEVDSPWYSDHMFFGDRATANMWSSPLQFSRHEIERVAGRAARLQDIFKRPVCHENAFYYAPFPGSTLAEADFIAELVERAGTYLHLDLHNIYANGRNFADYDPWRFLRTIPLDRVLEIHIAGGEVIEDWYHDLHNHRVPGAVWEMLEYVLANAPNVSGVCLETQGPHHIAGSRRIGAEWVDEIKADLDRARELWVASRASPGPTKAS